MTLAELYANNANECKEAAERTDNPVHRKMLRKMAREWMQDVAALRAMPTGSPSTH
jgi:hypothetical protein